MTDEYRNTINDQDGVGETRPGKEPVFKAAPTMTRGSTTPDCALEAKRSGGPRWFLGSESGVEGLVRLLDVLAFGGCAAILFTAYVGTYLYGHWEYAAAVAIATTLLVILQQNFGLYDFETITQWPRRMLALITIMAIIAAALVALGFALKISDEFSRVWLFGTFLSATVTMIAARGIMLVTFRRSARLGKFQRRVAVIGASSQATAFIARMSAAQAPWQTIIGIFDDRHTRIPATVEGHPVIGNLDALVRYVRHGAIDVIIVALPWNSDTRLLSIIHSLRELPVHVYLAPDLVTSHFPVHSQEIFAGVSVLKIAAPPLSGRRAVIKAIEDAVLGTALVVISMPLMLACAIAVKLDGPGPILFRQDRYGFNNQRFTVLKFRSMTAGRPAEPGVPQAKREDPRITRVGRWLRRTSLDELPQLFNVLAGTMSLVGPRPHAVEHNDMYAKLIAGYSGRHRVKPGITGWAQINGLRGETDTLDKMEQRVRFDIEYVERWSLGLDLRILLVTAMIAWRQPTAY